MTGKNKSQISVVIPTKNEEFNIDRCIKSVTRSNSSLDVEIIVVDNESTDQTVSIAKHLGARVFRTGPERSSQRNLGAQKAKGQYLLFLDADMEIENEVLSECLKLADQGATAVILTEKSVGQTFWNKCRALEKSCYWGDNLIEAARFFDRRLFLELGGYDEELIASEDWDLTQRIRKLGLKIDRTKKFVLHHEKETNPYTAAKKKYYYGLNLSRYLAKHPRHAWKQYQPFRNAFWRNASTLAKHPIETFGLVILKTSEYLGGAFGLFLSKLR